MRTEAEIPNGKEATRPIWDRSMNRREFLKLAAVAGATAGLGAGLGGVLASCGAEAGTTTSSTASTGTTVSAATEKGREVKVGVIHSETGALAGFAVADKYWLKVARSALKDGLVCGDGKLHPFNLIERDDQSDANRAAQVAGDLINNDNADVLMASGGPEIVIAAADQCESFGRPFVTCNVPWQPFFFGRNGDPKTGFKWTWCYGVPLEDFGANYLGMWDSLPTNKNVGLLFPNDADGVAWTDDKSGLTPILEAGGYTLVKPGLYAQPIEDFTQQISLFKKEACEIIVGTVPAPDFTNFWTQSIQQGFRPKIVTIGKALLFPETVEYLGSKVLNVSVEIVWHASWPFKESLTGMTCQELADGYTADTGRQWTQPLGGLAKLEWVVDAYKRAKDVDDYEVVVKEIATTKMQTCFGTLDFTTPVDMSDLNKSKHPVPNVYKTPVGGGQWVKGSKFPFDLVECSNVNNPELPITNDLQPMSY